MPAAAAENENAATSSPRSRHASCSLDGQGEHFMSDEKKVTETTTTKDDAWGNKEKDSVTTETKSKEGLFGGRKETTKITEKKEEN
jgi:hypothetical protein